MAYLDGSMNCCAREGSVAEDRRLLRRTALAGAGAALLLAGCSPTVKIQAPDKPIEINLNVKIEQDVRVRIEKDLESVFDKNDKIF